jgi:hypothetical protein
VRRQYAREARVDGGRKAGKVYSARLRQAGRRPVVRDECMIIRDEQLDLLKRVTTRRFEDRTFAHVATYFPDFLNLCDEPGIRTAIHRAWQRASTYDIVTERGVWQFVDVAFMLGEGFDTDPRVPWAAETLRSRRNEQVRMQQVFKGALAFIDGTKKDFPAWGGDEKRLLATLHQLEAESGDELAESDLPEFKSHLKALFQAGLPARYDYIGPETMRVVVDRGLRGAHDQGLTTKRGVAIYTALTLLLGSDVATDPLYPWVSDAMAPTLTAIERTDQLFAVSVARMRKWL